MKLVINDRSIGPGHPPFVIAEMSANHNGRLADALKLIELAKRAGADAIKIQTYRADTITIDCDKPEFRIHGGLWDGQSLYELYEKAHTPWDWHGDLFARARDVGITLFSSPFDHTAIDLLEDLDCPAYKIASFEAVDLPLIGRAAGTGKPLIISTGMTSQPEIVEAIECARQNGAKQIAILHCVSAYPSPPEEYNLNTIPDMMQRFGVPVGISDHTLDNATALGAVALGANLIEKHVTLDRAGGGPDDSFSIEPDGLAALCRDANTVWRAAGTVCYGRTDSEKGNLVFRRSLYIVRDVAAGEFFDENNVRSIRPGFGLAPKHLPQVLGKRAAQSLGRGTALQWSHLADE